MSDTPLEQLRTPRRQPKVAILMFAIKFIRQFIRMMWLVMLPLIFGKNKPGKTSIILSIIGLVLSIGSLIFGLLSYLRYYYSIDDTSIYIKKGIIKTTKIHLPFERIQNINFEQNLLHQILGIVSLQIDSAGSSKNEIEIDALPRKEAEAIRDYILEKKRDLEQKNTDSKDETITETPPVISATRLLLHLDIKNLLKVGVSQNHLRTAGLILAVGWGFMDNIREVLQVDAYDVITQNANFIGDSIFIISIGLLLLAFLVSLVQTVLKYFDLKFYQSHDGFKVISGLLTRQEEALRKEKIQIIEWSDNLVQRWFKIFTLDIKQAISGIEANSQSKEKADIPGCSREQIDMVLHTCFKDYNTDEFTSHTISFKYVTRMWLYVGVLPMVLLLGIYLGIGFLNENWVYQLLIGGGLVPVLSFLFLYFYHKKFRLYAGHEYIHIRKGIIGTRHIVLPIYKVQAVELEQSIYQRRKNLATLSIHSANGSLTIPYFNLEKARMLQNYVLYKVETSERSWM